MRAAILLAVAATLALPLTAEAQAPKPAVAAPAAKAAVAAPAAKPAKAPTDPNLTIRESANSVKETLDKLAKAAEAKGAKVIARVDHAAGAKAVGTEMKPAEVLMFGNLKLGTPVMLGNIRAGLDLPLKVLAWEDAAGKVWLAYTKPAVLQARYRQGGNDKAGKEQAANFKAIADALDGLTGAAITK